MATAVPMTWQRDTYDTFITLYYLVFRKNQWIFTTAIAKRKKKRVQLLNDTHHTDKMKSFESMERGNKKAHQIEIKRFTKLPIFISRLRNEYRVSVAYVGRYFMWPEIDGRIGLHAYENDFLKNHMTPKTIPVIIRYFIFYVRLDLGISRSRHTLIIFSYFTQFMSFFTAHVLSC